MTFRPGLRLLLLAALAWCSVARAQDVKPDTAHRTMKNMVMLDVGSLVTRYLNFGGSTYYQPYPYMIGYRRILGRNALRMNIGGAFDSSTSTSNDSLENRNERVQYRIGIGYEHYFALGKRWMGYIGADGYLDRTTMTYRYAYTTSSYREQRQAVDELGIAAVAGIVYRFNQHMQLATETNYAVGHVRTTSEDTSYPSNGYDRDTRSTGSIGYFVPPTALIFRVLF